MFVIYRQYRIILVDLIYFSSLINEANIDQFMFNLFVQESEPISKYLSSEIPQEVKQKIARMGADTMLKMVRYISASLSVSPLVYVCSVFDYVYKVVCSLNIFVIVTWSSSLCLYSRFFWTTLSTGISILGTFWSSVWGLLLVPVTVLVSQGRPRVRPPSLTCGTQWWSASGRTRVLCSWCCWTPAS